MKTLYIILGLIAALGIGYMIAPHNAGLGAANYSPTFSATGTTNTSSTVNTTSTQVLEANWYQFAAIFNNGTSTINCYLDNKTAASSSVAANAGIVVYPNTSPQNFVTFGALGKIPYVGAVNCLANVKTSVGIVYN